MDKDISKRTVLVLLILTLVISVVGTWTILSQPSTIHKTTTLGQPQQGRVSVTVLSGPEDTTPVVTADNQFDKGGKTAVNIVKQS
jgi:hypothetical protein